MLLEKRSKAMGGVNLSETKVTKVRVQIVQEQNVVLIPPRLWGDAGSHEQPGLVSFGQTSCQAVLRRHTADGRPPVLGLGSAISERLGIPKGATIRVSWNREEARLKFGPVIGVFVWRPRGSYYMGAGSQTVRQLLRIARGRRTIAFAFAARDIDWEKKRVTGFWPAGTGWKRGTMPLPDVVYDQIPSRSLARARSIRDAREKLQQIEGLFFFNPFYLDKLDVHKALSQDNRVRKYLPATERLTSISQVPKWLRHYSTVYIKPSKGSLGMGVTKIARIPGGYSYRRTRTRSADNAGTVSSIHSLQERLMKVLPRRSLIIQRGLHLARYGGRPFDIRLMMQKTPRGRWSCTSMIARVAAVGSAVSNVAEGGDMISVTRAVRGAFRGSVSSRRAIRRLVRAARLVSKALEEQLGKEFGEFGVDMALDVHGRLWLIEVNSKPGRQQGENVRGVPHSLRRVLRFAIAKAGF